MKKSSYVVLFIMYFLLLLQAVPSRAQLVRASEDWKGFCSFKVYAEGEEAVVDGEFLECSWGRASVCYIASESKCRVTVRIDGREKESVFQGVYLEYNDSCAGGWSVMTLEHGEIIASYVDGGEGWNGIFIACPAALPPK